MSDNLHAIVDDMRRDLAKGFGGSWVIGYPGLADPLRVDVTPDGVSWLVRFSCGNRKVTLPSGEQELCVDPASFVENLYVNLRAILRALTRPTPPERLPS